MARRAALLTGSSIFNRGALHLGDVEIRGFYKEPALIQKILMQSLAHFKREWVKLEASLKAKEPAILFFNTQTDAILAFERAFEKLEPGLLFELDPSCFIDDRCVDFNQYEPDDDISLSDSHVFDPLRLFQQKESFSIDRDLEVPLNEEKRQENYIYVSGKFRYYVGLRKEDRVDYFMPYHCLGVREKSLERRYDLADPGLYDFADPRLREQPRDSFEGGGGGVKQLLIDQGLDPSDTYVRNLTETILPRLGKELFWLKGQSSPRMWCDWGNVPLNFSFRSDDLLLKNFIESKEKGLCMEILKSWGLIRSFSTIFRKWELTENGREAFLDIYKALYIQKDVLKRLNEEKERHANTPHTSNERGAFEKK